MSDPRLHSLHLEGQPRRDQFRAARQLINAACGSFTLAGDMRVLASDERLENSTIAVPPGGLPPATRGVSRSTSKTARTFTRCTSA